MMQRILLTAILLTTLFSLSFAQRFWISGVVTDEEKQPLIGANIVEKGALNGTVTDFDGRFRLALSDSLATLVISYVGYQAQEQKLDGKTTDVSIGLKADAPRLDEIVVTGYATTERERSRKASKAAKTSADFAPAAPPPAITLSAEPLMMARSPERMMARDAGVLPAAWEGAAATGINAEAGTLTAGEINDFSKWDLWQDISGEDLANWREYWNLYPDQRYPIQLTNQNGQAVVNAVVKLQDPKGNTVWEARTDNTGKAELWDNLFTGRKAPNRQLRLVVEYGARQYPLERISSFQQGYNFLRIPVECERKSAVDIVFVVDATGSMQDEIDYLKAELQDVIRRVKDTLPDADLSLGSVFYRDQGEAYLTRKTPLSTAINRTTDFINKQDAQGGGDNPEAVEEALRVAIEEMDWRSEAAARLMFLVLDAPPHQSPEILATLERLTKAAAARGIRIVPVACSGIDKSTEYLMRSLALATNGAYTFLTDDSGVGFSHIEPTTDDYDVEKLNALLARVIHQFAYTQDCSEKPPVASVLTQPKDTAVVVAAAAMPEGGKPESPSLSLRFYPNPSSGPVNVEVDGIGELFLADFSGKILERFTIKDTRSTIDIGRYPAGTYHLRFRTEDDEWLGDELVLAR